MWAIFAVLIGGGILLVAKLSSRRPADEIAAPPEDHPLPRQVERDRGTGETWEPMTIRVYLHASGIERMLAPSLRSMTRSAGPRVHHIFGDVQAALRPFHLRVREPETIAVRDWEDNGFMMVITTHATRRAYWDQFKREILEPILRRNEEIAPRLRRVEVVRG